MDQQHLEAAIADPMEQKAGGLGGQL